MTSIRHHWHHQECSLLHIIDQRVEKQHGLPIEENDISIKMQEIDTDWCYDVYISETKPEVFKKTDMLLNYFQNMYECQKKSVEDRLASITEAWSPCCGTMRSTYNNINFWWKNKENDIIQQLWENYQPQQIDDTIGGTTSSRVIEIRHLQGCNRIIM